MQGYATIRWRLVVYGELVAARLELTAGRGCTDNLNATMFIVVGLVYVAENRESDLAARSKDVEKPFRLFEAHCIQPGAAHHNGRVMQTDHDMIRVAGLNGLTKSLVFAGVNGAAGPVRSAAVNANNQPVLDFRRVAIEKGRCANRPLHEFANIVIAGHAMHRQIEWPDEFDKTLVSTRGIILDQIAGRRNEIRLPAAGLVMLNNPGKRCVSDSAPKASGRVTE